jgi:hypothetical protein
MAPQSASAARCLSGQEVRQNVSAFVHTLRDDVRSSEVRAEVKAALIQTSKAARGVKADTPKERKGLGAEISALARQLKDAENKVERAALVAQIHALQEQKRIDHTTAKDLKKMRTDVKRLAKRLAAKTDSHAEGKQVAAFAHEFMAQFNC